MIFIGKIYAMIKMKNKLLITTLGVLIGVIIHATFFKEILPIYPKNLSSLYSKTMCIVR